jgi:polyhydroxybutyrate depolymerase
VIAWHDTGGSGSLARIYFGIEQQAVSGAIVVYPDALPNPVQPGWDARPDSRDVRLFDALLKQAAGQFCIDLGRVFAAGHGSGADLARALACHRAGAVRGIAALGGHPAACPAKSAGSAPAVWSATAGDSWSPVVGPEIWRFFTSLH